MDESQITNNNPARKPKQEPGIPVKANKPELSPNLPKNVNSRASILRLPNEVLLQILALLDPCSSTCFGLSAVSIYPLHMSQTGIVGLASSPSWSIVYTPSGEKDIYVNIIAAFSEITLRELLLAGWLGQGWRYCVVRMCFVRTDTDNGVKVLNWRKRKERMLKAAATVRDKYNGIIKSVGKDRLGLRCLQR